MLIKKFKAKIVSRKQPITPQPSTANNGKRQAATDGGSATIAGGSDDSLANMPHFSSHQLRMRRLCYLSSAIATVLGVILLPLPPHCNAVGYSYTRFRGPVSGPEYRIHVRNGNGNDGTSTHHNRRDEEARLDYVAKPEYEFAYGVEDAQAQILHNRNEMRDGDAVKGVYSTVDPDGTLRVVKYTADDLNGFQAEVIRNGISSIHGQLQEDTPSIITHQDHGINNGYKRYQNPTNIYESDNKYHNPTHFSPTGSNPQTFPSPMQDYSNKKSPSPNYNYEEHGNYHAPNQQFNNLDEYRPQYEVTEEPITVANNDDEDTDDQQQEYEHNTHKTEKDKKKDYDDDDGDDDEDDYDESEELEDYEDAVKDNTASNESDEYY
uniref:Uncharacterized protein n=1 Tax=Stomoxys calcitrans TaxID=35570 RepID=A0A1I8P2M1_STOCA